MRHRLGLDATQRLLHSSGEIGPLPLAAVEAAVAAREAGVPLAYALERTDFAGLTFVVTPAVLIPRWETEWLVNKFEDWYQERRQKEAVLLDLGCGSGCIGLTVAARYPQVSVTLADVSEAALDVARVNAQRLGVLERCEFRSGDWLTWAKRRERFDAILCNPPYITRYDDPQLADAVRRHEPSLALFLDDEPQEFFFRLARKSVSHSKPRRAVRGRGRLRYGLAGALRLREGQRHQPRPRGARLRRYRARDLGHPQVAGL